MASKYRRGMMTSSGSLDYDQFTEKMVELLKLAWEDDCPIFGQAEPTATDPEEAKIPAIMFDINERVPSRSHKSIDPILYDKIKDEEHPTTHIELYRQWFDIQMDFFIYHHTNRDARILMEDFEDFLFKYKDHFKFLGISDMIFKSEMTPQVVTQWGLQLPQRRLRYLIRTERIYTKRSGNLQKVDPVVIGEKQIRYPSQNGNVLLKHYGDQFRPNE